MPDRYLDIHVPKPLPSSRPSDGDRRRRRRFDLTLQVVEHHFEAPWRDGTTHVVFEPLDFIAPLAALVEKPVHPFAEIGGRAVPASSSSLDCGAAGDDQSGTPGPLCPDTFAGRPSRSAAVVTSTRSGVGASRRLSPVSIFGILLPRSRLTDDGGGPSCNLRERTDHVRSNRRARIARFECKARCPKDDHGHASSRSRRGGLLVQQRPDR